MNNPVTIYLADDHQLVIDGLKLLISDEASMKVVGYANDGDTAYKKIQEWKPSVALIDLRMRDSMSGLEIIQRLSRTMKETRFVILSMEEEPRHIKDAMRAGASGYLLKNTGKTELMKCLETVLGGEKYFPNMPVKKGEDKPIFTPREFEIVKLVIGELTTPQIAEKLHLSPLTVETHRKSICRKTNTHNALGLIKFLHEHNIAF